MQNKSAINVMVSFLTWTSVFVVGVMVSFALFRVLVASGRAIYHLVHP